jgi:hypothetical protein
MINSNSNSCFSPDYTPLQMFSLGVFGGTYFRPIFSKVLNLKISDDYHEFAWTQGMSLHFLCSVSYDLSINHFGVSCGSTLETWESKGWITVYDPRGWVQWYCKYHQGRRTEDDNRQILRWLGVKSRFGRRKNPSNKIKQVLLHWAIKS